MFFNCLAQLVVDIVEKVFKPQVQVLHLYSQLVSNPIFIIANLVPIKLIQLSIFDGSLGALYEFLN